MSDTTVSAATSTVATSTTRVVRFTSIKRLNRGSFQAPPIAFHSTVRSTVSVTHTVVAPPPSAAATPTVATVVWRVNFVKQKKLANYVMNFFYNHTYNEDQVCSELITASACSRPPSRSMTRPLQFKLLRRAWLSPWLCEFAVTTSASRMLLLLEF